MTKATITWPPAKNSCATAKEIYFIIYIYIFLNMYLQRQDVFGYFNSLGAHDL